MKTLSKYTQKGLPAIALRRQLQAGFTLIELLVVIGILAVLLSIVLVAINPARQFAQANNTQRRSDVGAIINAVYQYAADNKGTLPAGMPAQGSSATVSSAENGTGAAFCNAIVPTYIAALPRDPSTGTYTDCSDYSTAYQVNVSTASAGNTPRITVSAPDSELQVVISVTR